MTSHEEIRFPPQSELPPGVTIARLPGVGRTWYRRGFVYWCRRVGGTLVLGIGVTMYVLIIGAVMLAAGPPWSTGFIAVLVAEIVFSLVTGVYAFRQQWRSSLSGPAPLVGWRTRAGVGAAYVAFSAGVLGALLMAVSVLLTAGFVLASCAIWLVPVPPAERRARRLLAEELAYYHHHGHPPGMRGGDKR
jgi:hypothetical protein